MKKLIYLLQTRSESSRIALSTMDKAMNDLAQQGYEPTGTMLHFMEKEVADVFMQHVLVQTMILKEGNLEK